ncbi:MAG: hypothetical protein ABII00_06935 [Elusimicrobiota bacterium]
MIISRRLVLIGFVGSLAGAWCFPPAAFSFLGLGKKKEEQKEAERRPLPGLEGGELSFPSRMAEEAPAAGSTTEGSLPTEVVIKGTGAGKLKVNKPPLLIEVDPFHSIRESLKPDQVLLLAESPLTVVWRRTHPEFLLNDRVIQPWRTSFKERPGIVFRPRDRLAEVLQRKIDKKEAKGYQWSLTFADEEGKVFQHYEGSSQPPEELVWDGQNDQGDWMRAGRAYSPVFMFTDPGGTPYTRVGKPLRFQGIVHQERDGLHISLDSSALFGANKDARTLQGEGKDIIRSAADLVKRRYAGIPIRVETYASSTSLAEAQGKLIETELMRELMLLAQDIAADATRVAYTDQRVEIVLVNR